MTVSAFSIVMPGGVSPAESSVRPSPPGGSAEAVGFSEIFAAQEAQGAPAAATTSAPPSSTAPAVWSMQQAPPAEVISGQSPARPVLTPGTEGAERPPLKFGAAGVVEAEPNDPGAPAADAGSFGMAPPPPVPLPPAAPPAAPFGSPTPALGTSEPSPEAGAPAAAGSGAPIDGGPSVAGAVSGPRFAPPAPPPPPAGSQPDAKTLSATPPSDFGREPGVADADIPVPATTAPANPAAPPNAQMQAAIAFAAPLTAAPAASARAAFSPNATAPAPAAPAPRTTARAPAEPQSDPPSAIREPAVTGIKAFADAGPPTQTPPQTSPGDASPGSFGHQAASNAAPHVNVAAAAPAFTAHASAAAAPAAPTPPATGSTDPSAVPVDGIAVEISARMREGKRRFEIRLDPPELGRIDVRLDVGRDGQVTSRLVVERAETLDLLRRDAAALERALQNAGLRADDGGLQFSLRDQSSQQRWMTREETPRPNLLILPDEDVAVRDAVRRAYNVLRGAGRGIDISV